LDNNLPSAQYNHHPSDPTLLPTSGTASVEVGYLLLASDSQYLYDTTTNAVVRVHEAVPLIFADYFRLDADALKARYEAELGEGFAASVACIKTLISESGMLAPFQRKDYSWILDRAELEKSFSSRLNSLILGVTEQCNLRCNYCAFSGRYTGERLHSNQQMTWDVAQRSIDYFLRHADGDGDKNVALYGGEPFLRSDLVVACIGHIRANYREGRPVAITVVTNGTLLDDTMIDYLVAHDVDISLSLDGPPAIHDKHRVYANGDGTHAQVMQVLRSIRSRHPEFLLKRVSVTVTFDRNEDLLEVFDFFSGAELHGVYIQINQVKESDCDDYSVSPAERERHQQQLHELVKRHVEGIDAPGTFNHALFESLFRDVYQLIAGREIGAAPLATYPCKTCIPGVDRLFVDTQGSFYPCEKVHIPESRLGHIDIGHDSDLVREYLGHMVDFCEEHCQSCWAYRLCSHCMMHFNDRGHFSVARRRERCTTERLRIKNNLVRFIQIWEQEPLHAVNIPHTLRAAVKSLQKQKRA
jgi:uncharacterized protein